VSNGCCASEEGRDGASLEEAMPPTELQEHKRLIRALGEISDWLKPGTNEGANVVLTRLTGPLDQGSFFGGADISRWAASGARGKLSSQGGTAFGLDFTGTTPVSFSLVVGFDLNTGKVRLKWTPPSQPVRSSSFTLDFVKRVPPPNGPAFFFDAETTSDRAVYSLTIALL
jgi:hypothetical protein